MNELGLLAETFGTPVYYSDEGQKDLDVGDVKFDLLKTDDWCTEYPHSSSQITTITPGYLVGRTEICGVVFDDTEYTFAFQRPVIASPTCTDDSTGLWVAWFEFASSEAYDYKEMNMSIDLDSSLIRVKGSSGASAIDKAFTAKFMLPNGAVSSFPFTVKNAAAGCVMTPAVVANIIYYIGDPAANDGISDFVTTGTCTGLTYSFTVVGSTGFESGAGIFTTKAVQPGRVEW